MRQREINRFVNAWGFCPHVEIGRCEDCENHPSQRSYSWSDVMTLTHATQIAVFGYCSCEDGDQVFDDCGAAR
jgi:uncharacterized protein Veg